MMVFVALSRTSSQVFVCQAMDVLLQHRQSLEKDLGDLLTEEEIISAELDKFFHQLQNPSQLNTLENGHSLSSISDGTFNINHSYNNNVNLPQDVGKLGNIDLILESLENQGQKMASQVQDCKNLSEHLSRIVRQLDHKQMAAQHALACTEDILSLKDCKIQILNAIDNGDLIAAVKFLRQVKDMDRKAIDNTEDYSVIISKEDDIKAMVLKAFQEGIEQNDIDKVLTFCPMLSFLSLQNEVLQNLLAYFNNKIFSTLSTEHMLAQNTATEVTSAYLDSLCYIYNTFYVIVQTYLHVVLQGLGSCYGDILFIQNIHTKVEQEVRNIMKKYVKYRNLNDLVTSLAKSSSSSTVNSVEVHAVVDEVALIIQYASKYLKYLKQLCEGAEQRDRPPLSSPVSQSSHSLYSKMIFHANSSKFQVFSVPLEFDQMLEEFINKYYLPLENSLLKVNILSYEKDKDIDSVFFVYQKVGLRSIASHNYHACSTLLQHIASSLSPDLFLLLDSGMRQGLSLHSAACVDYFTKYKKSLTDPHNTSSSNSNASNITRQFFSLMNMNTSGNTSNTTSTSANNTRVMESNNSSALEELNILELCISYTDRLNGDFKLAIDKIFAANNSTAGSGSHNNSNLIAHHTSPLTFGSEKDRLLKVCQESFQHASSSFNQLLKQSMDKACSFLPTLFHELFRLCSDPHCASLYIDFQLLDSSFEDQSNLFLLPRVYIVPLDNVLHMFTAQLQEKLCDKLVGNAAELCCTKLEDFIHQLRFSFAAALKIDEIVRALSALFTKYSTGPVRNRFARIREVMQVLTAPSLAECLADNNYSVLTTTEIEMIFSLRID